MVALKLLLNATPSGWRRPLPLDGRLDAETLRRVTSLSTLNSYGERLGTVGIRTFVGLARQVGRGFVGGHKLADFLNETPPDYVAARDIVNGKRDDADLIAGYAKTIEAMFQTAGIR